MVTTSCPAGRTGARLGEGGDGKAAGGDDEAAGGDPGKVTQVSASPRGEPARLLFYCLRRVAELSP